uniref:Uncharacterized protein n=1 Tax=Lygus hesperus TaxID=30085 RepID=A0A146LY93_LYGHE
MTHGMTLRLLLMKYFRWSVDKFHHLWNPENCQIICLERVEVDEIHTNNRKVEHFPYKLLTPLREDNVQPPPSPAAILRRLFHRKWGVPKNGTDFTELSEATILHWIQQQHLEWGYNEHRYTLPSTVVQNCISSTTDSVAGATTEVPTRMLPLPSSTQRTINYHPMSSMEDQQPLGPLHLEWKDSTQEIAALDQTLQSVASVLHARRGVCHTTVAAPTPTQHDVLVAIHETLTAITCVLHTVQSMQVAVRVIHDMYVSQNRK